MAKKKVDVDAIRTQVNEINRKSVCEPAQRLGMNMLLESILHDAGCYRGFNYLPADQVPEGQKPGILLNDDDPQFPDETRRIYF